MAYTEKQKIKILNTICEEMAKGESLRSILESKGMPAAKTFFTWIDKDEEKRKQYARGMNNRQEFLFEEILKISNNPEIGHTTTVNSHGTTVTSADMVAHRRLQIEARKWMLGKMNPKKYGEKLDLTSDGDKMTGGTVVIKPQGEKPDVE